MPRSPSRNLADLLVTRSKIQADNIAEDAVGGGVTSYATASALPSSGLSSGDLAFSSDNEKLYISNGTGWIETPTSADLSAYATTGSLTNYATVASVTEQISAAVGGTVIELASPTIALDLANTDFKVPLSLNTTFSTTNHPTAGKAYKGSIELIGNAETNTHNIYSNPNGAIASWKQSSSWAGGSAWMEGNNTSYGLFCASDDGVYVAGGRYTGTSTWKLTVAKMSTPFVPSTATQVHTSGNIWSSLGTSLTLMKNGGYFRPDNQTIHVVGKYINAETGSIGASNTGTLPNPGGDDPGNWSSDGTKWYVPYFLQNGEPYIRHYSASTPFAANSLTLQYTATLPKIADWRADDVVHSSGSSKTCWISNNGTVFILGGLYISNNNSSSMVARFSLSTPFDVRTATRLSGNVLFPVNICSGKFIDNGNAFVYGTSNGFTILKDLSTQPVLNTTTWPDNWYWENNTPSVERNAGQVEHVNFTTTNGGNTFYASSTKY